MRALVNLFENKLYAFCIFIGNDRCDQLSVADFLSWIVLITWAIIDIWLKHIRCQHKCRQQETVSRDQIGTAFLLQSAEDCELVESFVGSWLFFWGNFNPASECCRPIMLIYQ